MKIAVASGKGGTGKTMVAVSMATSLASRSAVRFVDCDVEAPNAHLFLKPKITSTIPAVIQIPEIKPDLCTACGECVNNCEFSALAKLGKQILVFPQLCHGCGNCTRLCPQKAIIEIPRTIGTLSLGTTQTKIAFYMGELSISEPMPTQVIRQLKSLLPFQNESITILDSPPGASCAVVATVHDADFVLLVTEPTPFGLHDLKQMIGVLTQTKTPGGVILNRDEIGNDDVETFLKHTPYPILMKIPYQNEIAVGLARGEILTQFMPTLDEKFKSLYDRVSQIVEKQWMRE